MQIVSCHRGQLQTVTEAGLVSRKEKGFSTGLSAVDELLPGGVLATGAVHELLAEPGMGCALFFAALLAKAACAIGGCRSTQMDADWMGRTRASRPYHFANRASLDAKAADPQGGMGGSPMSSFIPQAPHPAFLRPTGAIVWSDPRRQLYPPALAAMGIPLDQLLVLHPKDEREELWAAAECMRCRGVCATLLSPRRLSRIEARRLQLAVEAGGGIGILLRTLGPGEYAAATRWLVRPVPGARMAQRWQLQLIHGHGGRIGQCVILENCRETDHVRAFAPVADRVFGETRAVRA